MLKNDGAEAIYGCADAEGAMYGDYLRIEGDATEEEIAEVKKLLVRQACGLIEAIAEDRDDFFIIKNNGDNTTIAYKFFIPSINIKE